MQWKNIFLIFNIFSRSFKIDKNTNTNTNTNTNNTNELATSYHTSTSNTNTLANLMMNNLIL